MNHPRSSRRSVALGLFVAGEFGKSKPGIFSSGKDTRLGFWWASAGGLAIAAAHIVIALAINDDWNHAVAWRVTEERTRELFGFGWGGAVAANYALLAFWPFDLWRLRTNPAGLAQQPAIVRWISRAFVLGIIVPAAIVFASGTAPRTRRAHRHRPAVGVAAPRRTERE